MYEGIKARLCKHSVGLMYKCGVLDITSDVRSKPLGQKRRRGRPKKLPFCLVNSPDRFPTNQGSNIPRASYIPSPNTSLVEVNSDEPVPVSPLQLASSSILNPTPSSTPLPAVNLPPLFSSSILVPPSPGASEEGATRKRSREVSPVTLPPAKRISRQTSENNPKKSKRGRRKPEKTIEHEINTPKTVKIVINNISPNIFDVQPKVKGKYNKRK